MLCNSKNSPTWDVAGTTDDFSTRDGFNYPTPLASYLPLSVLLSDSGTHFEICLYHWLRARYVGTKATNEVAQIYGSLSERTDERALAERSPGVSA